uniref:BBS1 domain-containing protein n=1 Tax=Strongyloides venezuelensis TaxID=75913 RepID=A0A0K0FUN8_STRVS
MVYGSVPFTTVAFNKFCDNAVEFRVGLENGSLQKVELTLTNGICGVPHVRVSFNEDEEIHSICFLDKNKVVYSVGEYNIFTVPTNSLCINKNWLENVNFELKAVTNLTVKNDYILLGIMDGKIYAFEEKRNPYEVYSAKCMEFIDFEYDLLSKMMLISRLRIISRSRDPKTTKPILVGIKKIILLKLKAVEGKHTLAMLLEISKELLCEGKVDYLCRCNGIVVLNKPQFFTSKVIKIPVVIVDRVNRLMNILLRIN